jgi:hypothetical protein
VLGGVWRCKHTRACCRVPSAFSETYCCVLEVSQLQMFGFNTLKALSQLLTLAAAVVMR